MRTITTHKNQTETYSTLPHLRTESGRNFHCDNRIYERFDAIIPTSAQQQMVASKFEKHSGDNVMTTFGHKRSPSGESLNRNVNLVGAKLVLPPANEIPVLKPVDKSLSRPRLPPPGPPSGNIKLKKTLYE